MRDKRRNSALKVSTALIAVSMLSLLALLANPRSALAACMGVNTTAVLCDAANPATAGTLPTTNAGSTTVNVNPGGQINTGGANASVSGAGNGLTFHNNDTVFGIVNGAGTAVTLSAVGGALSYDGSGTVAGAAGIVASTNGAGAVTVTTGGAVTSTAGNAINATGVNGLVTVNGQGAINATGGIGINIASSGTGGIAVSTTAAGTVNGTGLGIVAQSSGSAGNLTITTAGVIGGGTPVGRGIEAAITNAANAGTVTITANANVNATADGLYVLANGTGGLTVTGSGNVNAGTNGIFAQQTNTAAGTNAGVHVGGSGDTTAAGGSGISATIGDHNNAGNVLVDRTGNVTGSTIGITAITPGGGSVTVTGVGNVSAGIGIIAASSGGNGSVIVAPVGSVTADTGIIASAAGTGTATVTITNSVTGTGGTAIQLAGANNLLIMSGPAAALTGSAIGGGTDTFRLSGAGTNTFNVSRIGAGWTLLDKAGPSNWTLTGTSTYAGPVTVNGGTLSVNGNLTSASSVTVNTGGTLGGTGTLPTTTINAGGTLSPGNSIGTININGNLVLGAGAIYRVEVSLTSADRTNVTGTATLGAGVQVAPLARLTTKTTYTILSAATLSGIFSSAAVDAGNNFGRNPVLSYAGGNVLLTLDPGLLSPLLSGSATANQRSVAGGVDSAIQAGSPLSGFDALFNLSTAALPGALDQFSGEVHASTAGALVDESLYVRSAILGRLRQASYGGDASMASLSMGGPQAFAGEEELSSALAYAKSPIVTKAPLLKPAPSRDIVFWSQGFGAWGKFNSDGNAAALRRDLAGFVTGFDARFGDWRGGIAAGYTGSRNNTDGRGSANVETGHIAAYGGVNVGALNLRAGGAYAFHSIDTDRTITFPGFFDRATAHYQGGTGQIFGEAGYGFAFGKLAIEPFAGAAWVRLDTDAFSEKGGVAALSVAANSFEVGYSTLGVRAASLVPLDNGMVVIPRASAAWQHAFNSVTPDATVAFQSTTTTFVVAGVPIARDSLLAEAGLDLAISRNATIGVSYTGQIANDVQDHAAKGRFSWKFN